MTNTTRNPGHITILGGGPAGLTAGYFARENRLPFTIYEASSRVGGNSITLRHGAFLFDSGAHSIQTKDEEVIKELRKLLQHDLRKITLPIQTYYKGSLVDFPFSPLNLLRNIGLLAFAKANFEILSQKFGARQPDGSFQSYVHHKYGKTIGQDMLLNYSEKLWGSPCNRLSSDIAGELLTGLRFRTFLTEALSGRSGKIKRLGGPIYYPKMGFGMIMERLSKSCGSSNIVTDSQITKIIHNHQRIQAVEINGRKTIETDQVISTLPLNTLLHSMKPLPPEEILGLAEGLSFRSVVLVTLFLDRESVTQSTSVHFPDKSFSITRIHEPKNRSEYMAPRTETSLVAEVPCHQGDAIWNLDDEKLIQLVRSELSRMHWIKEKEVFDGWVSRLNHAYPVLHIGYQNKIRKLLGFLHGLSNLKLTGRNGTFAYLSFHHIVKSSKKVIQGYVLDG